MKVTIVTATTGRDSLKRCMKSVANQTHKDVQHLIFVDGKENFGKALVIMDLSIHEQDDVIFIASAVGKDRWNGHRAYGASAYLAKGEYIMYLDDDNTIEPDHVESCLSAIQTHKSPVGWAYSLRKIVDQDGQFVCNDDCESLGPDYPTVINQDDRLVDVNCYFLHKTLAVYMSPIWYRKAREPGVMEVDRALVKDLAKIPSVGTGKYSVNYAVNSTQLSVSSGFFLGGNEVMKTRYPGGFPWAK